MSDPATAAADAVDEKGPGREGGFPSQALGTAIAAEWVTSGDYRIRPEAIQPASIDLRLGDFAWALRCSFLPDVDSTVEEKIEDLAFQKVDLRDGAVLERDRPYLVPLIEELALTDDVRAKANPKSSTDRPPPPLRRDPRGLQRQALPGGGAALLRGPGADRALAQPAAPGARRRAAARRGDPSPPGRVPAALPRLARVARVRALGRRRALPQRRPLPAECTHRRRPGAAE